MACLRFFLVSLAFCSLAELSLADCPISGCTASRSFTSGIDVSFNSSLVPQLLWSSTQYTPSGSGCVTDGGRAVCPLAVGYTASLISWNGTHPEESWTASLNAKVVLPLIDITGGVIASDGYTLVGYYGDGTPRGPPVSLYPTSGEVFDLSITEESVIIIPFKCGFIDTYLANGVPLSGMWLNDTINGTKGTFVPLGDPAVNGTRTYLVGAFRSHDHITRTTASTLLRIFAIDIRDVLSGKIKVVWTHDLFVNGRLVTEGQRSPPLSSIMVERGTVISLVNYCTEEPCEYRSLLIAISDDGSSYTVKYEQHMTDLIKSLAYYKSRLPENEPTMRHHKELNQEAVFWLSKIDTRNNVTVLEEWDLSTGDLIRQVDLRQVYPSKRILATTDVIVIHPDQQIPGKLFPVNSHPDQQIPRKLFPVNSHPDQQIPGKLFPVNSHSRRGAESIISRVLIVGVVAETDAGLVESLILALDVSEGQKEVSLLWKLTLPGGLPAVGQIATLTGDSYSLMIVTTSVGTYAYLLA